MTRTLLTGIALVAAFCAANVRADMLDNGYSLFTEGTKIFGTYYLKEHTSEKGDWTGKKSFTADSGHIYGFTLSWDWDAGNDGLDLANVLVNGYAAEQGLWSEYTGLPEPEANTRYFVFDSDALVGALQDFAGRFEFALHDVAPYPIHGRVTFAVWEYPTSEVPEPATLAIMGLGLAGIGLARRRKK